MHKKLAVANNYTVELGYIEIDGTRKSPRYYRDTHFSMNRSTFKDECDFLGSTTIDHFVNGFVICNEKVTNSY